MTAVGGWLGNTLETLFGRFLINFAGSEESHSQATSSSPHLADRMNFVGADLTVLPPLLEGQPNFRSRDFIFTSEP